MDDTREHAKQYIADGWSVVPIPRGEKGPIVPNWQDTQFGPEDFKPHDNIGVKLGAPSGGLVDIDLDAREAVLAAPKLLLRTGRISGRAGKPNSHYWYICPDRKYFQFKDVDGSSLVEIRSTGQQTVLPPSQHKSGDIIRWESLREIVTAETNALWESARLTSIAALLARHWPGAGSRHQVSGLIAGFLVARKLQPIEVEYVVEQAAIIAGDDAVQDRVRYARDTCARFASGQPTTGGPKLSDEIGETVVKLLKSWFAGSLSLVEELNERHAVIFQQSGDLIIITEDRDIDNRPFLRFSAPETIKQLYPQPIRVGQTTRGAPIYKPLGDVWLKSPQRRFFNGIELAPNGRATPGYYNMWRGFTVEPKRGDWSKFRRHIEEIICCEQTNIVEYVLAWMAQCVQKPGNQANTAIALRGGEGIGKGAFVRGFGHLFGVHFVHLDSTRHLTGNFNAHLHNAILVFADEAAWPGDKAGLGALKRMVTEPTLTIERKGMDVFTVPNLVHMILASNEDWIVPAGMDSRRFVVLDVNKSRRNDTRYFAELEAELHERGGLAAMLYDLLNWRTTVDLRIIPKTQALFEQKRISAGAQQRWWYQTLQDGDFWRNEVPGRPGQFRIDRRAIYENYVSTLDRVGQRAKSVQTELGLFLKKMLPEPFPLEYRPYVNKTQLGEREWIFPSLRACRNFFDEQYGITTESNWPKEEVVEESDELPL